MKPNGRRVLLRAALAAPVAAGLAGCDGFGAPREIAARWVGASHERGHRLRTASKAGSLPTPATRHRAGALVLGGGIAGLSALRALVRGGVDDAQLLELEDDAGGNSRGHVLAGFACPLGAHYLPVPGPQTREVSEWLHEVDLLRLDPIRRTSVPDERHLCHSPQERLFIDGAWQDGLLPSATGRPGTLAQYRRFARQVAALQRELGFALPTLRVPWTSGHAALDAQTFAAWLKTEGLDDERLLAYLDYACRDDYGAGLASVSAWAGIHYFASRHGFLAPGDDERAGEAGESAVFTWPEGNGWLARRLAAPNAERIHTGRTVLRVDEDRHAVRVLVWNEQSQQAEAWSAPRAIVALPLFVAARVLANPPPALVEAASRARYAPWLVSNLHLKAPLLERPGAAPSWDNVAYAPAGTTTALGYIDASHQALNPVRDATVLTVYSALPEQRRGALLNDSASNWVQRVIGELTSTLHPDLPRRVQQADLMRYGHAMRIPVPGARGDAALAALRAPHGRLRFAHADLVAYSVFEEAFTLGIGAAA
ncbi:MAG TPA: FAD-dependent oxidoreductase [Ideonella sp.]|uniref:FAD-dependent oxidoreductase n=1 Tax=Ideonella sp. TaxID=1929293 RepID=UPI002E33BEF7|nr:FAD-dependent oxidoreductase [Ideonella sp.]HEX5687904.1 FAD-dependent oxidoreductase [Ideonella sp.]